MPNQHTPLPEFTRVAWVSDSARNTWEPRIARIRSAWTQTEGLSVQRGIRKCAVLFLSPQKLTEQAKQWIGRDLVALPIGLEGAEGAYRNAAVEPTAGGPIAFRVAVGTLGSLRQFKAAIEKRDDETIGELLGYPECCRAFFRETWLRGTRDTSWAMAVRSGHQTVSPNLVQIRGDYTANILWRWMGVRAVPHLPCSVDCVKTHDLGNQLVQVCRDAGYTGEAAWIQEILSWPLEWSALHGIAEIKTPILKISTRTDLTSDKRVIRREGSRYPEEGARGVRFPYRTEAQRFTNSSAFRRGLQNASAAEAKPNWYASDNGFSNTSTMDRYHDFIVDVASRSLNGTCGNVIDLGCGNGALLKRLRSLSVEVVPFGIDSDALKVAHARMLLPAYGENFRTADIFDQSVWSTGRGYRAAFLMPGRLLETKFDAGDILRRSLMSYCDMIILYRYGDPSSGDLSEIAFKTGFELLESPKTLSGLQVALAAGRQQTSPLTAHQKGTQKRERRRQT